MIKLLLTLIMMFAFGTSTVNAEENTTSIEDRISELAETKTSSQSTIKTKVGELSENELEKVIENVNELAEQTEDDLAIKEAAISKLEEIKNIEENVTNARDSSIELTTDSNVETPNLLVIGMSALGISLMLSALTLLFAGYRTESRLPLMLGVLLIVIMKLFAM